MGRKVRSDSKLDSLADHHQAELTQQLLTGQKYEDVLTWLEVECGVSSSLAALSAYYSRHCAPVLRERRKLAVLRAQEFSKAAKENPIEWDAVAMERLNQIFFELLLQPDVDAATAKRLGDMILKDKALSMDSRKVAILEKKVKAAEEAKEKIRAAMTGSKDGGLSEEALKRIEEAAGLL
jgi:hypothetical protein